MLMPYMFLHLPDRPRWMKSFFVTVFVTMCKKSKSVMLGYMCDL